ncbi:hypothetical protein BJ508DRAFT_413522 [Ascobolus immersus RN42]|uniref:Thioesterase domain-containing protein n=1 Tax=Ascobolus immersus RN42 TaxID=1160509 RepID=A0A3N4IB56_ASCIM|nr:hypothetical protein BJ508DRAFT_413522 [Ascobolus immersus RN42]
MPADTTPTPQDSMPRVSDDWVGQFPRVEVPPESLAFFKENAPWAYTMATSPDLYSFLIPYTLPKVDTENTLLRDVLRPAGSIEHHICLYKPAAALAAKRTPYGEVLAIYALGSQANGYQDTAHGGIVSVLFDELLGMCIGCDKDVIAMTLEIKIAFKRRLTTPKVVLARGRIVKEEGRKLWLTGELVDGDSGQVHAVVESLWIVARDGSARLGYTKTDKGLSKL